MLRSVVLGLAWLGATIPAGVAAQQPPFGPMSFEEGAPINRLSYTPMMESADVVPVGSIETDI